MMKPYSEKYIWTQSYRSNPLNDSMMKNIKSIPESDRCHEQREIVYVNLNGTRYPADIVSKNDFDFMRQDGEYWLYGPMIRR